MSPMRKLVDFLPDAKTILSIEPEELAGPILEYLHFCVFQHQSHQLNRYSFTLQTNFRDFPSDFQEQIQRAVMEAWVWLEREGLIAPIPGQDGQSVFITRRGQRFKNSQDVEAYRKSTMLPRDRLHPIIAQEVWVMFLRGDYDTAVFKAFKEVEVIVREKGGFTTAEYGTDLMRKAFNLEAGPLTDMDAQKSERQALSDLFSGAIGSYKNPHSHRRVSITAEEAAEMIMLASHLLRIVDSRRANQTH